MALKDQSATIHPDADRPGCYLVEVDWADYDGHPSYSGPAAEYRQQRRDEMEKLRRFKK
ncbi:hypothetical protein [Cupriavidus plantarum]|uniref:hypothetical protein n=1 Tax=Cupriavidus plantarum TaxID=942865 RepID=UPI00339D35E0